MRMTMVDKKGMIGLAGLRVGGDVPLYVRGRYATGVAATVEWCNACRFLPASMV